MSTIGKNRRAVEQRKMEVDAAVKAASKKPPRTDLSCPQFAKERAEMGICDLCGDRPNGGNRVGLHHLIPKLQLKRLRQKGEPAPTVLTALCGCCHSMLHQNFTHSELARKYPTVEALKADDTIQLLLANSLLDRGK